MIVALATAAALELAPLHLVPGPHTRGHVGVPSQQGESCPPACELQLPTGQVLLRYDSSRGGEAKTFSIGLPPGGATVAFSDPPFRDNPPELLGPACMLEGALVYGIGAAMDDNGWKGFGLVSLGVGAVALVVGLLTRPAGPTIEAHDAQGKPLQLHF